VVTAKGRSVPALTYVIDAVVPGNINLHLPAE